MIRIYVSSEDINNGVPTANNCPVALSLKRRFPSSSVSVYGNLVVIDSVGFRNGASLEKFVHDFDNKLPVTPRFFRLVPENV